MQQQVFRAMAGNDVADIQECATTAANYAERVAKDLEMNVPSESLARHSPAVGINVQIERRQSAHLYH